MMPSRVDFARLVSARLGEIAGVEVKTGPEGLFLLIGAGLPFGVMAVVEVREARGREAASGGAGVAVMEAADLGNGAHRTASGGSTSRELGALRSRERWVLELL